jgi:hypothetical protein
MKVIVFFVAFAFFIGALLLFGYAFSVPEAGSGAMFFSAILAVCISFAIPFHLLEFAD